MFCNKMKSQFLTTFLIYICYICECEFSFLLFQDEETLVTYFILLSTFQLENKIHQHLKRVSFFFDFVAQIAWSICILVQV